MANQIIIDIGAAANDGTGDPLRTAFNYVNNNFSNVWNTGLPESNVVFSGNRILTANTNGNLVLAPNGTGRVVANVDIQPNANNTLNLGSLTRQWNTVYTRNISISGELTSGDLTVNGNLTVSGDIIEVGNIVTDSKTIQLANTAANASSANGSGVTVGANDDIATLLYNSTTNTWNTNIGVSATGNISAPYFIGNGALLTGLETFGNIAFSGANIQLAANVANTNIYIAPSGSTSNAYIRIPDNASSLGNGLAVVNRYGHVEIQAKDGAAVQTWYFREDGSFELPGNVPAHIKSDQDILIQTGSGQHWTFGDDNQLTTPGNINPQTSNVYSLGNATNQWSDLWVSNATIYMNSVPIGLTAGNVLTIGGEPILSNDSNTSISTTGNITANVITATESADLGSLNIYAATISMADDLWNNINISPNVEGWAFVQIPKDSVANVDNVRLYNSAGNVELGSGDFSNDGPSYSWLFDKTGNLTIPNGGYINFVNTGGLTQALNEDLKFTVSDDEEDGWAVTSIVNDGAGTELTRMQVRYDGIRINTDVSGLNYSWDFRDSGEFDVPKSIRGPVGGNLIISIGDQPASDTFIDLQTRSYVGDALISNIRIANPNVTVSTASGAYNWTFDGTGNLVLPPSGNIVGTTPNNAGRIQWVGNSSGDGAGYTTLGLIPDDTLVGNDQYLIIDPTAPGHIHIRAGGQQDNSNADLFLGGENSYFKVPAGANSEVRISANSHVWTFGADSTLYVPGEGVIRSIQDTVILQSVDVLDKTYSARLGTTGGLYFETTDYPNGWLSITNSSGDANITAASGTAGGAGKSINITAGSADQGDYYTTPGGDVNIYSGIGAFNDGGGGGPGGNINIVAETSADPAGHAGNVNISAGVNDWVFDYAGNLTLPSNTFAVNYANGTAVSLNNYGDSNVATFLAAYGSNTVSTTGNITAGNFIGTGSNVELVAGSEQWTFDTTGVLTVPGNITGADVVTANTFVSNAFNVVTAGNLSITSQYGLGFTGTILEDNGTLELIGSGGGGVVVGWDSTYGNGLGNIATVNFNEVGGEGILLRTGNRAATEYNWNFDSTGNLTLPGNTFSVNYANGTPVSLGGGSYGNADVSNFLANYGSNTIVTTGNITGNTSGYTIGYRDIPQVTFSANATAALTDAGKHFYSTTAGNLALTLPDNSSVAFPTGATLTIVVNAAGNVLVNQGTGVTLYQAGASATGNRVVGAYGLASVMKVAANTWVISGTGVY